MTDRELEDIRTELIGIANRLLGLMSDVPASELPGSKVPDVQWHTTEVPNDIKDFLSTGRLTRTRVPDDVLADRASRRMRGELLDPLVVETDVEPHDDIEGLFDRLREETDG